MRPYKINEYQHRLIHNKRGNDRMIADILINGSYEDIMYYYDHTPTLMKGIFKHRLAFLIRNSYNNIYYTGGIYLKQPLDYVGLMAFVFPLYKDKINKFIILRKQFEDAYITGNYDICINILDNADKTVSFSAWGATNRIRTIEFLEGAQGRANIFNDICESCNSHILRELCSSARDSASIEASTLAWYEQKYKTDVMAYAHTPWQKDFIVSHLYPYKGYMIGEWMSFDMLSSIVDLYINFIYNLRLILPGFQQNDILVGYLDKIHDVIDDPYLDKYCELLGIRQRVNCVNRDALMTELYCESPLNIDRDLIEGYINDNPTDIDFLLEYIKCLVDGDVIIEYGDSKGCVLDRIKYHLFHYLKRNNPFFHLSRLKIICQSNISMIAYRQLYMALRNMETEDINEFGLSNWCYSYGHNLLDACYFQSPDIRDKYILGHWNRLVVHDNTIANIRVAVYMQSIKPIAETNNWLEELVKEGKIPPYQLGMVVSSLIEDYMENHQFDRVVDLYVNIMMEQPSLNVNVDRSLVYERFSRDVDLEINNPLDLSIFYTMIDAKPAKIQANAYRYLSNMGVDRPSKLNIDSGDRKQIYYLEKVVDRNILDLFPLVFSEPSDSIEERLKICQNLSKISDKKKYSIEINDLAKELGIMKMLKEVDASKIDVDENMLKKHEMKQGVELFKLYQETNRSIEVLSDNAIYADLFPSTDKDGEIVSITSEKKDKIAYRYLQFARFYLYVRDQFLLNDKAGLDYYMSSRIRHGTIVNQLRHHFQDLYLTTRKNDLNQYEMNMYWADKLFKLTGPHYVQCQEAFLRFTKQIDSIIGFLKNNYVQVKTEENNKELDACFDYSRSFLSKKIKDLYEADIDDYNVCVDAIFNDMWDRAEECFITMKDALADTELKIKNVIETLKKDVHELVDLNNPGLATFNDTITRCQTYLHEDISNISGWFQKKQSSGYDFNIQQLVDATLEAINKINTTEIVSNQIITSQSILASKTLNVFYDLFHNLLTNVIEHGNVNDNKAFCDITIKEDQQFLLITICNTISDSERDAAIRKIEEYKDFIAHRDSNSHQSIARSEGKSGMYKTDTIVYYQLKAKGNHYLPQVSNNHYIVKIRINVNNFRVKNEDITY